MMNWMTYGVIIIFGGFVILMILNPNLSCFGRKITSPLYPLLRHNKKQQKRLKTEDYGFRLSEGEGKKRVFSGQRMDEDEELFLDQFKGKKYRTKNYGFKLSDTNETQDEEGQKGGG
jgi:hypothetical protein